MAHPLAPDLTKLTDEELYANQSNLQGKLTFAYRSGNGDMVGQLMLLLDDYSTEVSRRNQKVLDDAAKSGKNFQDKINITK